MCIVAVSAMCIVAVPAQMPMEHTPDEHSLSERLWPIGIADSRDYNWAEAEAAVSERD